MSTKDPLRDQLAKLLNWGDAHATFERVVADVPAEDRGIRPGVLPWSLWELIEHIRLAQRDMLEFCTRDDYEEGTWPDDYWPKDAGPGDAQAWDESVRAVVADRERLQGHVRDAKVDLMAPVRAGSKRTHFGAIMLIADHTAYHLGQMIAVRRLLGNWKA